MIKEARFLLWKGHCSVHQRFRPEHVADFRQRYPDGRVIVHPECSHEVVELADEVGSTDYIIGAVDRAPAGTALGIGTEIHLVQRLGAEHPDLHGRVAGPAHLPVLHHVPHRRRPPLLGARGAGRRPGGQPHHRRWRGGRVVPGGAPAHARHHLSDALAAPGLHPRESGPAERTSPSSSQPLDATFDAAVQRRAPAVSKKMARALATESGSGRSGRRGETPIRSRRIGGSREPVRTSACRPKLRRGSATDPGTARCSCRGSWPRSPAFPPPPPDRRRPRPRARGR